MRFVFFLCASIGGAEEVAHSADELVNGVSQLPPDCRWVWMKAEDITPVGLVKIGDQYFTIARIDNLGYSAGAPFTS